MKNYILIATVFLSANFLNAMDDSKETKVKEIGSVMPNKNLSILQKNIQLHKSYQLDDYSFNTVTSNPVDEIQNITTLALSQDKKKIAVGTKEGVIKFYDLNSSKLYHELKSQVDAICRGDHGNFFYAPMISIAFSPNKYNEKAQEKIAYIQECPHYLPQYNAFVHYIDYNSIVRLVGYIPHMKSLKPMSWKDYSLIALSGLGFAKVLTHPEAFDFTFDKQVTSHNILFSLLGALSGALVMHRRIPHEKEYTASTRHRAIGWKSEDEVVAEGTIFNQVWNTHFIYNNVGW